MKLVATTGMVLLALNASAPASATDARVELRANVPTRCEMSFMADVEPLAPGTFSLGTVQQFCNTNFQLTLLHGPTLGKSFRFGNKVIAAGAQSTILESLGKPVIGTKQLVASGLDAYEAATIGNSLVLQVTPLAL